MNKAEISAVRRVDGMGQEHPGGSYVQISIAADEGSTARISHYKISVGGAEVLRFEIDGLLRLPKE